MHIYKENVINDLYRLCFQNNYTSLNYVVTYKNNLNCIIYWGGRGGGTDL